MRQIVFAFWVVALTVQASAALATAVQVDTPEKLPSGVTFTIPEAWSARTGASLVVLTPPEADAHVAVVDVAEAKDAASAVVSAWSIYRRGTRRRVNLVTQEPAHDGWDEVREFDYETAPTEHIQVAAVACRRGPHWTVLIREGATGTIQKRIIAVSLIAQTLRPAGYHKESFAGRTPHPLDAIRIDQLKSFVQTSMRELGVPGTAIALVDHGKVVFEGGFGVRALENAAPVDAHTLFMIGSNTKSLTTLLLAELVDEGKLAWDEPVIAAYPPFRLGDAEATKKAQIRHLVCACTGLPRKDYEWILNTGPATPASHTFQLLAGTQPTSGFGEVFQYNNLIAAAAGYVAGHRVYPDRELGAAYDAAMQAKVFNPLGMRETTLDTKRALAGSHASAYEHDVDGVQSLVSMDYIGTVIPIRPAGGAWSSAHDLIKYVRMELALGKLPDGTQLVSPKNLLARRQPNVSTGEDSFYGMGLEGDSTLGVTVFHHGGVIGGFESDFFFIPEADVGAVILTNADVDDDDMTTPFRRRVLEVLYDGKPEAAREVAADAAELRAHYAARRARLAFPAEPSIVSRLAVRYMSPSLGHITVRRSGQDVVFDFGTWKSHVASRRNGDGTVSLVTVDPTGGFDFVPAMRSGRRALVIRDGQHEYVYTEAP